jgi:hypothetical protein
MRRILLVCLLAGNKRLMVLSPTDLAIILLSFGSVTHVGLWLATRRTTGKLLTGVMRDPRRFVFDDKSGGVPRNRNGG